MKYSELETTILLGLKERHRAWLATGGHKEETPEIERLWTVMDQAYASRLTVHAVEGFEVVREHVLDRLGCSAEEVRVAIYMLRAEELIDYINNSYVVTPLGLRVCRDLTD